MRRRASYSTCVQIGTLDLVILLAYMAGVVLFGVWIGRRQRGAADYMLGGRNMPMWALLLSIVATETSTVTFLSIPGVAFTGDLTFLQLPLGYIIGRALVVLFFMPLFFSGQLFTAYEVLKERFGSPVRKLSSLLFMVTRTLADGLRLYLSAIVLHKLAGFDMTTAVVGLGVATILYTFVGGMRAVVWTDVIQFIVYMLGAALAFVVLLDHLPGGFDTVWQVAADEDKLRVFDFSPTLQAPYVFWAGLIGGAVFTFGTHGVDQMIVQRYLCARSQREAATALLLSGFVVLFQFAFFLLIGLGLYAYYQHVGQTFERSDEVFATFIVGDVMPPVAKGIVLGAVFSAAMSTLSSSLNSAATAAVNDFWLPSRQGVDSDRTALTVARWFTVMFGILQIAVGVGGQYLSTDFMSSVVGSVLAIQAFTTGIILGVFCLATFAKVSGRAALVGIVAGLVLMSLVKFVVPPITGFDLAWPWSGLLGALLTFGAGLLAERKL